MRENVTEKPEKSEEQQTQETMISATRRESLDVDVGNTAHTVINPDQADVDQLGETVMTEIDSDVLSDATMETVFEKRDDAQTMETAIATHGIPSNQPSPASQDAESNAKYKVIKKLGKGGFAWVYLVENQDLKRLEAMKILNTELAEDEEVLERFVKEARTSALFHHQNIVTIYEVQKRGQWNNFIADPEVVRRHREPFAYFTMSFVEGITATELVKKKKRLPQKDSIRIVMDTCQALEYAHGKGVVHRDIKPDNILVDNKGMGIVMDFGIAKVTDSTRQTAAGTFMGTARYVSPEQAMGKEIDARSDLYSLGVALYELATGRVPFDSEKWMTVLYQHINEPPPSPEKFYGDIDRNLRAVILKMLEKAPEDRFQTARETYDALNDVYRNLGGEDRQTRNMNEIDTRHDFRVPTQETAVTERATQAPPPVRTKVHEAPPEKKKSNKGLLVGLPLLLVVVAVIGFFATRPGPPTPEPDPTPPPKEEVKDPVMLPKGRLLINAFPRGQVLRITNEKGEEVSLTSQALPQIIELPEGTYKVVFSYQGQTKVRDTFVSKDVPLSRVSETYEVEDERFLLEDLR